MLDWNARNPFCAGCGQPTLSVNAGGKRVCPTQDASPIKGHGSQESQDAATTANRHERPPCATRKGISNLSFPRTDPTVIMAVVSSDSKRILLGRQKRWPPHWYSTLAGFCEPAESIEEAVRREVWEEAGVKIGRVIIHSSQPWPYPAVSLTPKAYLNLFSPKKCPAADLGRATVQNLMIGAIGQTIPEAEQIDMGNDPELHDAKWVEFDEMREGLRVGTSGLGEPAGPDYKEGGLRLPPPTAIANRLMDAVVNSGLFAGDSRI